MTSRSRAASSTCKDGRSSGRRWRSCEVACPAGESLDGWLKAVEHPDDPHPPPHRFLPVSLSCQADPPLIPPVTTAADGRFVIAGIGRERVATLEIQGPTIETVHVEVRTRPGATIRVPEHPSDTTPMG